MNIAKTLLLGAALVVALTPVAAAQEVDGTAFELLNLEYPGLEAVSSSIQAGDFEAAAANLLDYYRGRTGVVNPEMPDPSKVKLNQNDEKWANDALEHRFFVHVGYQPSYFYGEDIDWQYWPVKDNELRWQLHRHKWFSSLGRMWRVTGEEKYAREWTLEYLDWIAKNPLEKSENARYAWRPLEVSHRVQDQVNQFQLFLSSENFTPAFLTQFLVNYHRHADYLINHYTDKGNHLLFEAQRVLLAGSFFREFKDAELWRRSGVDVLNREIRKQVYEDGGQFELCPHYHLASIEIFQKSLAIAQVNGFSDEFPESYKDTIEKMAEFYANICYPDYTNPCFSDARIIDRKNVINHYRKWHKLFPDNAFMTWMATGGKDGATPDYLSRGFLDSGFFVFRNSWGMDALQMVIKAGPPGEWHCQPDNGTIELWYNGKILFQDSGSYIYGGDKEILEQREWFRATAHHNTLTLDGRTLETTDSRTLLWQPEGNVQALVTENQSYKGLKHRRSVFFVDGSYFVIVDEALGDATGKVNLNFQLPEGKEEIDCARNTARSLLDGNSNYQLRCFGPKDMVTEVAGGWVSRQYKEKQPRTHLSFNASKNGRKPVRFVTVIVPEESCAEREEISASLKSCKENSMKLTVKIGKGPARKIKLSF